jgi:hypothetical protein
MRALVGALALVAVGVVQDLGAQAPAFPAVVAARLPSINTGLLRPGTDQYVVFMVREGRREVLARVTDEVSFVEVAPGDTAIRRVYQWATGEDTYSHLDTLVVDRTDLTLRRYSSHGAGAVSRLDWADGRLRGEVMVNGKPKGIDAWLNASVYVAGSLDLVARASILSREYSMTVSTFSPESGTIAPAHLTVTGLDSIGVPQWRVQSDVRGLLTTYWVDRRSHRIIREARYMGTGFRVEVVPVSTVTTTSK